MIKIRRNVFETNSSSTHSVSISFASNKNNRIPQNEIINVTGKVNGSVIFNEFDKLQALISLIVEHYSNNHAYKSDKDWELHFNKMISSNLFQWVKELVQDHYNTEIKYYNTGNYFPYMETACDDYYSLSELLECNLNDAESFKKRIATILFDDTCCIEIREELN